MRPRQSIAAIARLNDFIIIIIINIFNKNVING